MRISICTIIVLVLAANISSSARADMILNGGFESGGGGGAPDAAEWDEASGDGVQERSFVNPRSGNASMRFLTDIQGGAMILNQSPSTLSGQAPTLAPGDEVYFEYYLDGTNIATPNFAATLTVWDDGSNWTASTGALFSPNDDNTLGTYLKSDSFNNLITVPTNVIGPVKFSLSFDYVQPQPNGVQTEIFIDDVKLLVNSIPEPSLAMTSGLAILGVVTGQRRRRRT